MRLIRSPGRAAFLRFLAVTSLALTAFTAWLSVPANAATDFANPAFRAQWSVGENVAPNFWGPLTLARDPQTEPYVEAVGSMRQVQYFDKARMELNNPSTNAVTNGLLATELITGRLQRGDNTFDQGTPAGIPVAGDPDNLGPTYASINANKANLLDNAANITNAPATKALKGDGTFGSFASATTDANTIIATFDTTTSHNVPKAFVDYRNKAGIPSIGLAISEPFWSNVKVGGTPKDVLIQAFERRVLTYTPSNADPFKVEFGNIGQHYYTWRYQSPGVFSTPTPAGAAATSTAAAQTTSTAAAQATGTANATGTATTTTTATATGTVTATTTTTATATTTADTVPPKFRGAPVVAYATPNSFTIIWGTDEPASSELVFGEDATNYNQQNFNLQKVFSVDHQVVIRSLSPGKTYHWKAQSRDPSGNLVLDDQDRTVTLPADKNDGTMGAVPRITNLSIAKKTATTFTVTWTTDVASRSRIEYGKLDLPMSPSGEGYDRWRTGDNGDPISTNHSVTAVSLMPTSAYRFRIVSIFGDGGITSSAGDDRALMSTVNSAITNDSSTAIKINDFIAPKQDRKGTPVVFSFGTDRNAVVIIEIGTTNQFGGGLFYGSSDDPQGLRDYPYSTSFNRSRHTISLNLQPGTYYYRVTVFDEQGTGTITGDKTITVT